MFCSSCGSEAPDEAAFCGSCGAPMQAPPKPVEPVAEPAAEPSEAEADRLKATVQGERDAAASFVEAVLPVIKMPIVVFVAVAAAATLVASLVASLAVNVAVTLIALGELDLDDLGDWWDFAWMNHFSSWQIPVGDSDAMLGLGSFLFVVIAIGAVGVGIHIATLVTPVEDATELRNAPWIFAAILALANLILGLFGPDDVHAAWFQCLLFTSGIGFVVATWRLGTGSPLSPEGTISVWLHRVREVLISPVTVLIAMIAVATVITLVANIVQILTEEDDKRAALTYNVTSAIDNGWATVAQGMLVSATAGYGDDEDETSVRLWNQHDDEQVGGSSGFFGLSSAHVGGLDVPAFLLTLIAGFGTVILGGLYAGFRTVRESSITVQRDAAIAGALVGPAWALATIVLSLAVTDRISSSDGLHLTLVDGVEVFFFSLLIGSALGAIGGVLATSQGAGATPAPAADA